MKFCGKPFLVLESKTKKKYLVRIITIEVPNSIVKGDFKIYWQIFKKQKWIVFNFTHPEYIVKKE